MSSIALFDPNMSTPLVSLPNEVLEIIVKFLGNNDSFALRLVSKRLNDIIWKLFNLEEYFKEINKYLPSFQKAIKKMEFRVAPVYVATTFLGATPDSIYIRFTENSLEWGKEPLGSWDCELKEILKEEKIIKKYGIVNSSLGMVPTFGSFSLRKLRVDGYKISFKKEGLSKAKADLIGYLVDNFNIHIQNVLNNKLSFIAKRSKEAVQGLFG